MSGTPHRILIDARGRPQTFGGVAHATKGLIQGLASLEDGEEHYVIVVSSDDNRDWLEPAISTNQTLVDARDHAPRSVESADEVWPRRAASRLKKYLKARLRGLVTDWDAPTWPQVPISDGLFESLGCDVLHIPSQHFVLCAIPTVYNPHDLQHLHYPQFFRAETIAWREAVWRTGCQMARCVMVGSGWVKHDVVRAYGIPSDKVQVIPEGARTQFLADSTADQVSALRARHGLAQPFILYPAVTWPHKNHCRLFEAMRILRDESGLVVHLVCTGAPYDPFWPEIERRVAELDLSSQVTFLGFVPDDELHMLYSLAEALVFPSLFEASSLPIFEAWQAGVPVACSRATALPEQVMDAALLFDPEDVGAIAEAVSRLMTDRGLRQELVLRGTRRLQDFDWTRTARAYRAVYRRTTGRTLTDEDRWLLSWESMGDAGRVRPSPI